MREKKEICNKEGVIIGYEVVMTGFRDGKPIETVTATCDKSEPGRKWNPTNTLLQMAVKRAKGAVFKACIPLGINVTYSDDDQAEGFTDANIMSQGKITTFWNQLTKKEGYIKDQVMKAVKEIMNTDKLAGMTEEQSKDIRTYLKDNYGQDKSPVEDTPPPEDHEDFKYDEEALRD